MIDSHSSTFYNVLAGPSFRGDIMTSSCISFTHPSHSEWPKVLIQNTGVELRIYADFGLQNKDNSPKFKKQKYNVAFF